MKLGSIFMVLMVSIALGLSAAPAEAKRLGGGASFGKSYKYKRDAKPFQTPAQPTSPAAAPAAAGAAGTAAAGKAAGGRGLLGPLAGLAAGGLLAAMFFGGAFEGIQILDILLIAGIIFLIFTFMKKRAAQRPMPAGAGSGPQTEQWPQQQAPQPMQREAAPAPTAATGGLNLPEIGSGLKGDSLAVNPSWFNEAEFMAEADGHFRTLQAHWDSGDMDAISEYTTPEMAANLRQERAALTSEPHTEVIQLHSQLLDLIQDGDKIVAAILFSGLINEDRAASASQFAEIWHVEHDAENSNGDWLLAGIIQHHM